MIVQISGETLRGQTLFADGKAIGTIAGLFINTSDWCVEAIRIELRNDIADRIGVERTLFRRGTLVLPVGILQAVGHAVVLTVNVEQLRDGHFRDRGDAVPQHVV